MCRSPTSRWLRASSTTIFEWIDEKYGLNELPGASVFYKDENGDIFHTYSSYARGVDILLGVYNYPRPHAERPERDPDHGMGEAPRRVRSRPATCHPVAIPDGHQVSLNRISSQRSKGSIHVIRRRICGAGAEEEPQEIHGHRQEGRPGLEGPRRARLLRGRRRRREARQMDVVPAEREAQEERDRDLLLYHLQVARAPRPRDEEGHERQAAGEA